MTFVVDTPRLTAICTALLISLAVFFSPRPSFAETAITSSLQAGFDNTEEGNQTIRFEDWSLDPQFGDKISKCSEDTMASLPQVPAHRYSCYATLLAGGSDGQEHKFRAQLCRYGVSPSNARMRATYDAKMMTMQQAKNYRTAHQESISIDRISIHCKNLDAPDEAAGTGSPASAPDGSSPPISAIPADTSPNSTSISYEIVNHDRGDVGLRFYSRSGNRWPGARSYYNVSAGSTSKGSLSCSAGESVCYGAWRPLQDADWGVGRDFSGCTDCCTSCGGSLTATLGDPGERGPAPVRFLIHNADRYKLGLKFYSKTTGGTYPGNGQQYNISGTQLYKLACTPGEKICFGAWRDYQTTYWGVGRNDQGCDHCCTECSYQFETTLSDGGADAYPAQVASGGGGDNSGGSDWIGAAADVLGAVIGVAGAMGGVHSSGGAAIHYGPAQHAPGGGISGVIH